MRFGKLGQITVLGISALVMVSGCSSSSAPLPTSTPEPSIDMGDVSYDGTDCDVNLPDEIPPGRYSLTWVDNSDLDLHIYVSRLTDGHTYEELIGGQNGSDNDPYEFMVRPEWLRHAIEPGSAKEAPGGGEIHTYILREGEHAVYVARESPFYLWICAPLRVVDGSSE